MIKDEKYVKIVSSPAEKVKTEVNINNQDITITQNGDYQAEPPYTGFGLVRVAVPTGGSVINPLSVSPSTQAQVINAPTGVDGFNPVSVAAVTAVIDSNIQANNIKAGVSILGVTGNVIELNGEERTVSLTSSSGNTFTPSSGKNAITSITVTPNNYAEGTGMYGPVYEIVASTEAQNIQIPQGYSGFANLFCDGVDASIDSNIVAGNIKDGVTILGVIGTYTGGGSLSYPYRKLSIENNKLNAFKPSEIGLDTGSLTFTDVGNVALTGFCYGLSYTGNISYNNITTVSGGYAFYYAFRNANITGKISFNGITTVTGGYAFSYGFFNLTAQKVEFTSLTTVSGEHCFDHAFAGGSVDANKTQEVDLSSLTAVNGHYAFSSAFTYAKTNVNLSSLTTVFGSYGLEYAFQSHKGSVDLSSLESITGISGCRFLFSNKHYVDNNNHFTTFTFTKLKTITASSALSNAFASCPYLTSIYFPALLSTSFGSYINQFNSLLSGVTGCTIHFPSNLDPTGGSTVISSLSGYPNFGGTNTVLAFDLPATE